MTWWAALPGGAALIVAVLGFVHNFRTLKAAQPRAAAEKQGVDIDNLRDIIAELRQARIEDRAEFGRQVEAIRAESAAAQQRAAHSDTEAATAHKEAATAQHAIHQFRVWYINDHLPYDQAIVAAIVQVSPGADLPKRIDPPLWDDPLD